MNMQNRSFCGIILVTSVEQTKFNDRMVNYRVCGLARLPHSSFKFGRAGVWRRPAGGTLALAHSWAFLFVLGHDDDLGV